MWKEHDINERLARSGLDGARWGERGLASLKSIEAIFGVQLGPMLGAFVEHVGNLRVGSFNIIVAGDGAGSISASTETRHLRIPDPKLRQEHPIKIMGDAGESFLYFPFDGRVAAYDSQYAILGQETLTWQNLEEFIDWVFNEAREIADDPPK